MSTQYLICPNRHITCLYGFPGFCHLLSSFRLAGDVDLSLGALDVDGAAVVVDGLLAPAQLAQHVSAALEDERVVRLQLQGCNSQRGQWGR